MQKAFNFKSKKGFSLIELLISITLLLIVAVVSLPLLAFAAKANSQNKFISDANMIASGIVERIAGMKFENIGNKNGNPRGDIELDEEIEVDGVKYQVRTLITWGRASSIYSAENYTAFKNIRVIIKGKNAFTGLTQTFDEVYTISSREGEQEISNTGNILVTVMDVDGEEIKNYSLTVTAASSSDSYTMVTDYAGEVLFGELDPGTYTVTAEIPQGFQPTQGENIEDGKLVKHDVAVIIGATTKVDFHVDKPGEFCGIALEFFDETNYDMVCPTGIIAVDWQKDGVNHTNHVVKNITNASYSDGVIPASFIGALWPQGSYRLSFAQLAAAGKGYVVSSVKRDDGSDWPGTFSYNGQVIRLRIGLTSRKLFYKEDLYADFYPDNEYVHLAENVEAVAKENEDGSIVLSKGFYPDYINLSHHQPFDGNYNTYCEVFDNYIYFDTNKPFSPTQLRLMTNNENLRKPNQIILYGKAANGSYVELCRKNSGFLGTGNWNEIAISTNESFSSFRLYVDAKTLIILQFPSYIHEIQLIRESHNTGRRLLRFPLYNVFTNNKAPELVINWGETNMPGTDVKLYMARNSSAVNPPVESSFTEITDYNDIQNLIIPGSSIPGTQYLWIKQEFISSDDSSTPSLDFMEIHYSEAGL